MASPDRSKRKILKAKKTMPSSCRKQVEVLNKSKNAETLKTAASGNNISGGNRNSNIGVVTNKCRHSENDAPSLDSHKNSVCSKKSEVLYQNLVKPLDRVNLETRLGYIKEQVCPYQKLSKTIESPRKLSTQEAKDSQNISEKHCECQAYVTRPFFEQHKEDCNLKSTSDLPNVLSGIVQMPVSTEINTLHDKKIDKMVSHLETSSNSASHGKKQNDILILSSGTCVVLVDKRPTLVKSGITSNYDVDIVKSEESHRTCHSSISNCENTDSLWLSSLDTDNNNSHSPKKRMFSENKENVKRLKTSEKINENVCGTLERRTAFLDQVKHLIRQEVHSISYKVFDNKLKELAERIGKTQCSNRHGAIADELLTKIEKIQKRIINVLSQRNCLEPNMSSSNTAHKVTKSEAPNLDNNQHESKTSVNSEFSNPSGKASKKVDFSQVHDEPNSGSNDDDMIFISAESPRLTTAVTSNLTDTGKTTPGNYKNSPDAETKIMTVQKKKLDSVIDLTKEHLSNCNTEDPVSALQSPMKAVSVSEKTPAAAKTATQLPESFEHLPPLPEPPPPLHPMPDKIRDTLPPQKPELKVKRVLRPRGIALTWNITKINPKCAPVESYHLFLCHEIARNKLVWKKIGEIKALPLPMACTLSQFLTSNRYYFTVQSKDIFGRYGPFCDIKSIPGFSDTGT